ncbi:M23 family metallopeptidase [Aliiroseovarius crassostreae]|uniref:M23 family metallopeptidase n=1 Tax=Aliiroseovarius crassostreae TaxID=154981 RepID=UPI003C7C8566
MIRLAALIAMVSLTGCVTGGSGTAASYRPHVDAIPLTMPKGAHPIAQQFMPLSPGGGAGHKGIDIAAPTGTPILAAAPGRVTISLWEPAYGNRVVIEHGVDDQGRRVQTLYFHLETRLVQVGDRVDRGEQIGTLGATGVLASYPHLHFEYHRENAPGARTASGTNWWQGMTQLDPNRFWADGVGRVTCFTGQDEPADKITYPTACH